MKPVSLMRLRRLRKPTDVLQKYNKEDLIIEEKYDGFKVLAVKEFSGKLKLYTRRGISFEENVPPITNLLSQQLPKGTSVLGELLYIEKGKQILAGVQSIVNASEKHALNQQKILKGHLEFVIYDIIEYNGKMINNLPLYERRKILKKIIRPSAKIKIIKSYPFSKYKEIIKQSLKHGGEGLVIKKLDSKYLIRDFDDNEPHGEWYKYKDYDTDEVLLKTYFFHQKEKKAIFPAYKMKNGKLIEIGKLTNLETQRQNEFMKRIDKGEKLIVEVEFQERFPSGKVRAMAFVRDRSKEKKEI